MVCLQQDAGIRHDWRLGEVEEIFSRPFNDLIYLAHTIHRRNFDPNRIQVSRLISIKTGACPEDCAYCPQSAHYSTGVEKERLSAVEDVVEAARQARESGASRFCLGAAWRGPGEEDFRTALEMVKGVKELGIEACASFGLLSREQVGQLKEAGLDYYNHNIDTSPEHYAKIVSTRSFADRLETLGLVREAGLRVCSGGIVGLGESVTDRAEMLIQLANLSSHPDSVPINLLIPIPGTPLAGQTRPDVFDFVRTIAVARILMPHSYVRLSAGRDAMSGEMQALCFLAGANSIFSGDKLLTVGNASPEQDAELFGKLGLTTTIEARR